jgi:hypothetical protein
LKVVPERIDDEDGQFYQVTNADGDILIKGLRFFNPQYYSPVAENSNGSYRILFTWECFKSVTYSRQNKQLVDADTGEAISKNYLHNEEFEMKNNPFVSLFRNVKKNIIITVTTIDHTVTGEYANRIFYCVKNEERRENSDYSVSPLGISNTNDDPDFPWSELQEKYTHFFASCNLQKVYFDYTESDMVPKIFIVPFGAKQSEAQLYKSHASTPVISDDDTIFAYNYSENASYSPDCKWQTIIEKDGQEVKRYPTKQIVFMDEDDAEIYVIDPDKLSLEVLDMADFQIKYTAGIDKGFIFPQIADGKLQYTCPVYEGDKIMDYVVKEEQ